MKPLGIATQIVESELPMETAGVAKRVQRAVNDILLQLKVRYELVKVHSACYQVLRYSTSIFEDNSMVYAVTKIDGAWQCTCPDYTEGRAPFNLCKHRLAVQIQEEMGS